MVNNFTFKNIDELVDYFDNFNNIRGSLFTTLRLYSKHSFYFKLQLIDIDRITCTDNVCNIYMVGDRRISFLVPLDLRICVFEDFTLEDENNKKRIFRRV